MGGPSGGAVYDVADATNSAIEAELAGKDSTLPADAFKLIKGNTPFINFWYAKAVLQHLWLDDLKEQIQPGYLERMQRADDKHGNTRWLGLGKEGDVRSPNFSTATGATL